MPKVAVVAEFYPSRRDPVLGIWAHRQALAARDAGAEVRVLVLHRLVPPRASLAAGAGGAARALSALLREPRTQTRDGLEIVYVPYLSPPRERAYAGWGDWYSQVGGPVDQSGPLGPMLTPGFAARFQHLCLGNGKRASNHQLSRLAPRPDSRTSSSLVLDFAGMSPNSPPFPPAFRSPGRNGRTCQVLYTAAPRALRTAAQYLRAA